MQALFCMSGTCGCTLAVVIFAAIELVFHGKPLLSVKAEYRVKADRGILFAE